MPYIKGGKQKQSVKKSLKTKTERKACHDAASVERRKENQDNSKQPEPPAPVDRVPTQKKRQSEALLDGAAKKRFKKDESTSAAMSIDEITSSLEQYKSDRQDKTLTVSLSVLKELLQKHAAPTTGESQS